MADCDDYRPDHNGECLNCDEPADGHRLPTLCGRCYDIVEVVYPSGCAERPEATHGAIGMYHCPDCGAMVLAGMEHPAVCERCRDRRHPGFDGVPA